MVTPIMISDLQQCHDLDFAEVMNRKSDARARQVAAVYAADPALLDQAAARIKAVWLGQSGSLARPKRFSALDSDA